MTDLDALKERLTEAAVLADGLIQEARGDDRADLALLGAQLAGSLYLVTRLLQRQTARSGRAILAIGELQRREIDGRSNVELVEPDTPADEIPE